MKALARYHVILLDEQRHIRCEQLAQGCCPNNGAAGVNPRPLDHESSALPLHHRVILVLQIALYFYRYRYRGVFFHRPVMKADSSSPVTHPKLKYINQMLGAHILMMNPNAAINVPEMVTARHPNLLVRALAIGPGNSSKRD